MFLLASDICAFADVNVSIVAVNATEEVKTKDIKQYLPSELAAEDIYDTDGLQLEYDVNEGAYFVRGEIELQPKETKTFRVRVRDLWRYNEEDIEKIRQQIEESYKRQEGTPYAEMGKVKRDILLDRLDFLVEQEDRYTDDVGKRIDQSRAYAEEFNQIRTDSINVKYWRALPPSVGEDDVFRFIVKVENKGETEQTAEPKHYLPSEVKPEHIIDTQGLEIKYDGLRKQLYLTNKETLGPKETKQYEIGVADVWNIDPIDIENLKDRARKTYALLEPTEYKDSAQYLVSSVKDKLEEIEASENETKVNIKEHISAYRTNMERYGLAQTDVKTMEALLEAVRENLERSKVKNVLQKITQLKTIAEISKSIFKKPKPNTAWKIIMGCVIAVGVYTFFHFTLWGKRSREAKLKELEEKDEK